MKKLLIVTLGIAILSGCASTPAATQQTKNPDVTTPSVSESETKTSPASATQTTELALSGTTATTSTPSPVDQVAYDGARQLNDKSYCIKISDSAFRQSCLDQFDKPKPSPATDCATITDTQSREACKLKQQIAEDLAQKQKAQTDLINSETTLRDQAIAALDITKCKNIQTFGLKQDCQVNIILQQSQKTKDPTVCDQLATIDPTAKELCIKQASN